MKSHVQTQKDWERTWKKKKQEQLGWWYYEQTVKKFPFIAF